ncbi:MAG: ATP-binding protein [Roseiflexaceae bacterium]
MFHALRWPLTRIFYSLRWRLTGWYMLLLTAVLLLFSAGIYITVYKLLLDNFDDLLASQANLIVQTIDFNDRDLTLQNASLRADRRDSEHLTRIYRADRTLMYDDNPRELTPELTNAMRDALDGHRQIIQVSGRQAPMRVLSLPITHNGQIIGALQVGISLEDVRDTLRTLLKVLLVLAPALLLVASGGGLFLANRALMPIDRLTRTAQRISAEDLSQRLNLQGVDDEVGRLAHTFDAMLARLQSAFEQQRHFTADASHELRTPLTAIIGQIDVAIERPRDAESYRATLDTVREQARRLTRLANDLLFLARADTQPALVADELIDLGNLLPAIVAQVEPLANDRQQLLTLDQPSELFVHGNEDDLIRLFLNLLDNAIRYTPHGGQITITAAIENSEQAQDGVNSRHTLIDTRDRTHTRAPAQPSVIVSIHDTGPGVKPEHLPRLFDRFFRVDRGRNRAQGGSGLGLAIAQSIATTHGGRLEVRSAIGQGSTFIAILPCAVAPAQADTKHQIAKSRS